MNKIQVDIYRYVFMSTSISQKTACCQQIYWCDDDILQQKEVLLWEGEKGETVNANTNHYIKYDL